MKTNTRFLTLTAALALTVGAAPTASALQTEWVATGTVYGSQDEAGLFGPAGSSLDGDSFTADFYIDTSKGIEDTVPGVSDEVYGGSLYPVSNPITAKLTINGVTEVIDGSRDSDAVVNTNNPLSYDDGLVYVSAASTYNGLDSTYMDAEIDGDSGSFPDKIGQQFQVNVIGNNISSDFFISDVSGDGAYTAGTLAINSFTSAGLISSAPEASTWTLLIVGAGFIGAALRVGRRRSWTAAA